MYIGVDRIQQKKNRIKTCIPGLFLRHTFNEFIATLHVAVKQVRSCRHNYLHLPLLENFDQTFNKHLPKKKKKSFFTEDFF